MLDVGPGSLFRGVRALLNVVLGFQGMARGRSRELANGRPAPPSLMLAAPALVAPCPRHYDAEPRRRHRWREGVKVRRPRADRRYAPLMGAAPFRAQAVGALLEGVRQSPSREHQLGLVEFLPPPTPSLPEFRGPALFGHQAAHALGVRESPRKTITGSPGSPASVLGHEPDLAWRSPLTLLAIPESRSSFVPRASHRQRLARFSMT